MAHTASGFSQGVKFHFGVKVGDFAGLLCELQAAIISQDRNTGGIVSPVFEFAETRQKQRYRFTTARISHDAAHEKPPEKTLSRTAKPNLSTAEAQSRREKLKHLL
jgi:hypothetical protein